MRVIAGHFKGRKLKMDDSTGNIRPTSDKVKGAVFNVLAPYIADCRFLDLFAGTGSVGIEALSRGAAEVTFVEKDKRGFGLLKANLALVGATNCDCVNADFRQALKRLRGQQFDIVYVDPPFMAGYYQNVLDELSQYDVLVSQAIVCLEHPTSEEIDVPAEYELRQHKRYGDVSVAFLVKKEDNHA